MTNVELQEKLKQFDDDMTIGIAFPVEDNDYYAWANRITLIEDEDSFLLTIAN